MRSRLLVAVVLAVSGCRSADLETPPCPAARSAVHDYICVESNGSEGAHFVTEDGVILSRFHEIGDHEETRDVWSDLPARVTCFATANGGSIRFMGESDGTIAVPDYRLPRLERHDAPVTCVAASRLGRVAISGDARGDVRLWLVDRIPYAEGVEPDDGPLHMAPCQALEAHQSAVRSVAVSHDGLVAASAADAEPAIAWDIASGKEIRRIDFGSAPISRLVFSRTGRVLSAQQGRQVSLADVTTGKVLWTSRFDSEVFTVAFETNDTSLTVVRPIEDGRALEVATLDAVSGDTVSTRAYDIPGGLPEDARLRGGASLRFGVYAVVERKGHEPAVVTTKRRR